jgi:CMP-N,N'-diacetyllegionaminic acid synthase
MRKILTVIPVRSGSQGVKNKNIRPLGGLPLLAHVILAAKTAANTMKIVVSTDTEEYANLAKQYGAETPFIRPIELGRSTVRLHHVVKHALDYFDGIGERFDAVLSLQATVPLVRPATMDLVIEKFHRLHCESVGTVTEIRHGHPYLSKKLVGAENDIAVDFITLDPGIPRYPRQVRPDLYYFNGSMFLRDRSLLDKMDETTNCMGAAPRVVFMDEIESMNIDNEVDFKIAEYFLKNMEKNYEITQE